MVRGRVGLSAMDTAYTIVQALARTQGTGHTHLNLHANSVCQFCRDSEQKDEIIGGNRGKPAD